MVHSISEQMGAVDKAELGQHGSEMIIYYLKHIDYIPTCGSAVILYPIFLGAIHALDVMTH